MTDTLLTTQDLICGYHTANPLTPPLNMTIRRNDIVAILGINGRGKSTVLHTLLGMQKPLSGQVITSCSLSFVPQHFTPTFDYSVLDIVLMGRAKQLGLFHQPSKNDIALAKQNLQQLGLHTKLDQRFSHLSGGQQQLVLIARALTAECQVLLLDEPTSALDLANQQRLLHILHSLVNDRDLTIILSTHDPAQAMCIANNVLLLEQNSYAFGAANELLTEQHLSRLYDITIKRIQVGQTATILPIYTSI